MRAANSIAEKALDTSDVERVDLELGAKSSGTKRHVERERRRSRWFHDESEAATKFTAPAASTYVFKIRASATQTRTRYREDRLRHRWQSRPV